MPIQVKCQCGKALKVKDELAGKAVKCPGCGKVIKIGQKAAAPVKPSVKPSAKPASKPAAARPPAAAAAPVGGGDSLDDLFDEEGFSDHVASLCPNCRAEMSTGAVFCTKCGFNKETGDLMQAHKTAGVDIDAGTMALDKAEADMKKADRLQREMESKAGMPWWMLALVIFMMGSGTAIAVIAVNMANRTEEGSASEFSAMALFLQVCAGAVSFLSVGALLKLGILFAKKEAQKKDIIKLTIGFLLFGGIGIGLLVAASRQ
ncbi:zinc ribbon domain-containing protein [Planctomycetes bacterium K23_9]|uniref:Double zinc ribbon n=1 Tax=Stieleria marina TaxID=1930275 RepID=A0A517NVS6_9BACT|nr:Double zinc ribbon [Planctomycetes bacterium K23_9]